MTDSNRYMKWFCRALLVSLASAMSYVVFQPAYNFAHWIPHGVLRDAGLSYSTLLLLESHADKILHPLGAFILTILLLGSAIPGISSPKNRAVLLLGLTLLVTELGQWRIGRGFDVIDLGLGMLGIFAAAGIASLQTPSPHRIS